MGEWFWTQTGPGQAAVCYPDRWARHRFLDDVGFGSWRHHSNDRLRKAICIPKLGEFYFSKSLQKVQS
jgi:hypothetical protein